MTEVTHQDCPYCGHRECYSYNEEKNVYHCFSCGRSGKLTQEEDDGEVTYETYMPDSYRGISRRILEKYGVIFQRYNNKEQVVYQYPHATKYRTLPKEITCKGNLDSFYGQEDYNSGGRAITITEGEEDRLSVIEMMGDWPCVSVPNATPSKAFWANAREYLSNFEKIYLSLDNDKPGDALAEKFFRLFPGKVYRVAHTKYKDANDFLLNGARQEYKSAWFNAQRMKPENILSQSQDFLRLYDEAPQFEYFPTGIEALDEKMLGIHKGFFTVVVAPTGIGKTEFMRYLEYKALKDTKYSIAICHLEETPIRSVLGLVSYHLQENVTRKDLIEQKGLEQEVRKAITEITKEERLFQFKLRTDETIEDFVDEIRFLVTAMGVDYIFFEPIQDIVTGDINNKESLLSDLSNTLSRLAPELNVGIVTIAHANEDGDTKYCKTIAQKAGFELTLSRDMEAEDSYERNITKVRIGRKNRTGGGNGFAGNLFFDINTFMLEPDVQPLEDNLKGDGHEF